jgi:hypothetical protein
MAATLSGLGFKKISTVCTARIGESEPNVDVVRMKRGPCRRFVEHSSAERLVAQLRLKFENSSRDVRS